MLFDMLDQTDVGSVTLSLLDRTGCFNPVFVYTELSSGVNVTDAALWDARRAQYHSSPDERERWLPKDRRSKVYAAAIKLVQENYIVFPVRYMGLDFSGIAQKLSSGNPVSPDDAEFVADMLAELNRHYLGVLHKVMKCFPY
jgi:hypothetical protein